MNPQYITTRTIVIVSCVVAVLLFFDLYNIYRRGLIEEKQINQSNINRELISNFSSHNDILIKMNENIVANSKLILDINKSMARINSEIKNISKKELTPQIITPASVTFIFPKIEKPTEKKEIVEIPKNVVKVETPKVAKKKCFVVRWWNKIFNRRAK